LLAPSVLIAQGHYGNDQINTDLLPQIKLASTPIPLPSGTYSVWVQDARSSGVRFASASLVSALVSNRSAL
jgi:hypothetical protein